MPETISTEVTDEGIGRVTLDRPEKRNALSIQLREELVGMLSDWAADDAVRVVTLTGAGPVFCAGFDLTEFADQSLAKEIAESSHRYHLAVWEFPKPLIAALNGPALAGGFDLAVLCDLRIAAESAVMGHPEIKLGAPPLYTPLRWIVGQGVARDLCLTGRRIDSAEALRIGLVTRVVPGEVLDEETLVTARSIAEAPQAALEFTKSYLVGSSGRDFADSFTVEHDQVFERFLGGPLGPGAP
ncbi:MAG: enoyl-CoA hydratase/isomerase family protein [Solirubrobacterales bacterium]